MQSFLYPAHASRHASLSGLGPHVALHPIQISARAIEKGSFFGFIDRFNINPPEEHIYKYEKHSTTI